MHDAIDTSTLAERFSFTIIAAVAELERELFRERTTAGLQAAKRRGAKLGRPRVEFDLGRAVALRGQGWVHPRGRRRPRRPPDHPPSRPLGCSTIVPGRRLSDGPESRGFRCFGSASNGVAQRMVFATRAAAANRSIIRSGPTSSPSSARSPVVWTSLDGKAQHRQHRAVDGARARRSARMGRMTESHQPRQAGERKSSGSSQTIISSTGASPRTRKW
ncbi:recombinase family protein [Sorangium sp. So ce362]|uniref:recombinase family protein n=1 Tax=Sorangium sp. So ce362 TaxID=3133303 RepID=UPI003F640ECE